MELSVGSRVKFLNEVGEGTVVKILINNQVLVETKDGFDLPCLISDLILSSEPNKKENSRNSAITDTNESLLNKGGKPEILAASKIVEPESNSSSQLEGDKDPDGESVALLLALVPENSVHPTDGKMRMFLVNDGSYRAFYVISRAETSAHFQPLDAGMLEPDTKVLLGVISQTDLPQGITLNFQLLFFKNREFTLKPAEQFNISVSSVKLLRPGAYVVNDFFDEKAMLVKLTEKDTVEIPEPEKIKEAMLLPKSAATQSTANKVVTPEMEEVDLHIEELVDDYSTLTSKEILDIQLARFTTSLEGAIKSKVKRIVFIHGVGNGKLKFELRKLLDTTYAKLRYQDASFKEYGYGATLVMLK
ncbi:MAG TPA: DUF2027 domain-containing protein [Williamwhitmania sp.]|nr:DUF2027 domain-containing protein [Williamwhitmania sp.]